MTKKILLLSAILLFSSCGELNTNKIWGNAQKTDSKLVKAELLYDRGEYDDALELIESVIENDKSNLKAIVLRGYLYMAIGGLDLFDVARKLLVSSNTSNSSKLTAATKSSTEILSKLGEIINISDEDFNKLGSVYGSGDVKLKSELFKDNDIIVPSKPKDVREDIKTLKYMNKAISSICQYIDAEAFPPNSQRYAKECDIKSNGSKESARLTFLWSFSHLTEAMVYQSVLLYAGTESASTSNFEQASTKMNSLVGSISDYSNAISDMAGAVDAVFDTSDPESMINESLNSLKAASLGVAQLKGMPDSLKSGITSAMDSIEELGSKISGGGDSSNSQALKTTLTDQFAKQIGTSLDSAITKNIQSITGNPNASIENFDTSTLTAEQQTEFQNQVAPMCGNFDDLTGEASTVSKPAACVKFSP